MNAPATPARVLAGFVERRPHKFDVGLIVDGTFERHATLQTRTQALEWVRGAQAIEDAQREAQE